MPPAPRADDGEIDRIGQQNGNLMSDEGRNITFRNRLDVARDGAMDLVTFQLRKVG